VLLVVVQESAIYNEYFFHLLDFKAAVMDSSPGLDGYGTKSRA